MILAIAQNACDGNPDTMDNLALYYLLLVLTIQLISGMIEIRFYYSIYLMLYAQFCWSLSNSGANTRIWACVVTDSSLLSHA